jgi:hypothetical protein
MKTELTAEKLLEIHLIEVGGVTLQINDNRIKEACINAINEAINYTHCCTELKDKKALTFEEWLYLNNYAKSNDAKYLDENANWFTEKQLLKMYNDIF